MIDEQILTLIRKESSREQGFRMLMNQYQGSLYQHIRRMVNDHDDTNDVLQNTFIKVLRHIGKFEGRSTLYTWIFRIATNEAITLIGKKKKLPVFIDRDEDHDNMQEKLKADNGPDPEIIGELLKKAMDALPEKQKSVFSLRYFEEMSYRQMADVMGTSEGALKASFHHAVKKIENYFKTSNIY